MAPETEVQPPFTASTRAFLLTPLQLQTWAPSSSSATPTSSPGPPTSNIRAIRSSGSGSPRS